MYRQGNHLFNGPEPFKQIVNTLTTESPMRKLLSSSARKTLKQDGGCGGHLGFPIGKILAIFDLKVILLLECKFQLKLPNSSGG